MFKKNDSMIDGHIHIEKGDYTIDWIKEFVRYAYKRGISEINLLEHSYRFKEFERVYKKIAAYNEFQKSLLNERMKLSLDQYKKLIKEVRKNKFPVKINFGLEVCFIEGTESIVKDIIESFDWDFMIGSVHWIDGWGFDHKKEFWEGKCVDQLYKRYYEIMKSLIKSGLFDILAHPDSIKCFGYYPSFDLEETYMEIADLLNKYNMYAEQNGGLHLNYGCKELGINSKMLNIFKKKNVKIITASDAHRPEDAGKYIRELSEL
ncbi:PHP domain-containing protein [Caloranaerobacter ferrireducens]|uniref:PHP domain-containing protein n=1 Tax=Caloranaerobacter ferrireducens TaxID=1323370 RepID=UPI001FA7CF6E|nr:PHP domain-containing protein [Caloranaerobacter ferrireducens]